MTACRCGWQLYGGGWQPTCCARGPSGVLVRTHSGALMMAVAWRWRRWRCGGSRSLGAGGRGGGATAVCSAAGGQSAGARLLAAARCMLRRAIVITSAECVLQRPERECPAGQVRSGPRGGEGSERRKRKGGRRRYGAMGASRAVAGEKRPDPSAGKPPEREFNEKKSQSRGQGRGMSMSMYQSLLSWRVAGERRRRRCPSLPHHTGRATRSFPRAGGGCR